MLASFLDKHHPEQMSAAEIKLLLGEPTGHAGAAADPAYLIVPVASEGNGATEQLLVFRTDVRSGRIVDVILRPVG